MRQVAKILLILFLVGNVSLCFGETIKADSKIVQVTAYPDSALITRSANLKLSAGEQQIVFSDIIPDVDENSLTVSGKGSAQVKIFGAQIKKEFLEKPPSEQVKDLEDQIQKIADQINTLNNKIEALNDERDFLKSIKLSAGEQIPKDLITKFPSAAELENLDKFLLTKLEDNRNNQQQTIIQIRELKNKKDVLERQKQDITGSTLKSKRSIVVELEAVKAGDLDLTISYLVRGVFWRPIYDARASFEQNNVELVFYGSVKQTTGEPWEDVTLVLSTAKPSVGGKMLELSPWYLKPYQPPVYQDRRLRMKGGGLGYAPYAQTMMSTGSETDSLRLEEEAMPMEAAEMVFATAEEKGTAVAYKVTRKTTIKSDGTEHKVPISSQLLEAKFEYAVTPKLSNYAYLMSKVKNSKEGQLLSGIVNIFLEGDFIGTSSIAKAIGAEEEFDLHLGIDEGITVKRKKLEEKTDDTLIVGIPSRTKTISYQYKLIVENYKSKKIKVNLYDQIPVSENDQILVKNAKFSEEPKVKDYLDRKGIMRWEFELEPKKIKEITLSYTIEHPRNMNVEGL